MANAISSFVAEKMCIRDSAYADIKQLHPRHIETTADGRRFIRINRKKTGVEDVYKRQHLW